MQRIAMNRGPDFKPAAGPAGPDASRQRTWQARRVLAAWIVLGLLGWGLSAADDPALVLREQWAGFLSPVQVTHAGDGSGRVLVVERAGRIRLIAGGISQPVPFLDLTARVQSASGEQGLLGVAFPPGFGTKGYFYVSYTRQPDGASVISRIHLGGSPDAADADSEEPLLTVAQPFTNHNGGQIAFGPLDGYLYLGLGDGGSGGDPLNHAQNPASLLGKILRLDVESTAIPYGIPATNPFLGQAAYAPEIWALGLRNPWRFSFDALTGDLYIGDVGQSSREEVNFQASGSPGGENYGWRIMEGTACYNPTPCDPAGLTLPVAEYDHTLGCSVTGGFVCRGERFPRMHGRYFFGDFCSGRIWDLRQLGGTWSAALRLDTPLSITCFGEGEAGDLYVADYSTGIVYALEDDLLYGDVSGDGVLGSADATMLAEYLAGSRPLAGAPLEAADTAWNGALELQDLLILKLHLAGQVASLPVW